MDVTEAMTLLEGGFRDAFRRDVFTTKSASHCVWVGQIRDFAARLTEELKAGGATPEAVILEVKRIARLAGGRDYPPKPVEAAVAAAVAAYFRHPSPACDETPVVSSKG